MDVAKIYAPTNYVSVYKGVSGTGDRCTCYCDDGSVCSANRQCPAYDMGGGLFIPGVCGCPVGC